MNGVVLVTGAASGIGAATAHLAAERGYGVALLDLDGSALEEMMPELRERGAPAAACAAADVADARSLGDALETVSADLGIPTATVCCAGVDIGGSSAELPMDEFDRVLAVNLRGTFLTCRGVIRLLLEADLPGAIVCVSSISALIGVPGGTAAYSASKGGVASMVRSLAIEYADRGIRINALMPGATETPLMWANVPEGERATMRRRVCGEIPLGRLADPAEQARAALWMLSSEAAYMTGAELVLDGGIVAKAPLST